MKPQQIFSIVEDDLQVLNKNLQSMVGARHPILSAASEHLFSAGGKRLRPALVLLVAESTSDQQLITASHKRLAEISEIIHTASLVHDDVIDECLTRRGVNTVHSLYNNKVAILAGDFLFAQSSWYLANLNNLHVVKTISKVITDFAEGEVRQGIIQFDCNMSMTEYIEKSFYKTASLIAASCQGSAMLSKLEFTLQNRYYSYGKHIGLAFQIIDDILDIIGSHHKLGKPVGSDLKNGNLTAPILFSLSDSPELLYIITNEFENDTDITKAIEIIYQSKGLTKAKDLAEEHIQAALTILPNKNQIPNNTSLHGLTMLGEYILNQI
uniref:Prenyl transferase n=1 Tax=Hommersandiophycus borowitzkae TaxID=268573 RepID=A0A1G4NU41_9FLOR|nr:Prenyl transferase [Hommersandiophycus borowitzkae]SCW22180.1 Prenyl transferase [Hommersandiophycus borowitzkae]